MAYGVLHVHVVLERTCEEHVCRGCTYKYNASCTWPSARQ